MNQGVNYHPSLPKCYKIWLNVTHTIKTYILIKTEDKRTFQVCEDLLYHLYYHFYARNFLTYKTSFHEICRLHCSVFHGSGRIHYHSARQILMIALFITRPHLLQCTLQIKIDISNRYDGRMHSVLQFMCRVQPKETPYIWDRWCTLYCGWNIWQPTCIIFAEVTRRISTRSSEPPPPPIRISTLSYINSLSPVFV